MSAETTSGGQAGEAVEPRWWLGTVVDRSGKRQDAVLWGPSVGAWALVTPDHSDRPWWYSSAEITDLRPAVVVEDAPQPAPAREAPTDDALAAMPVRQRDEWVAVVLRFMVERGYVITHPAAAPTDDAALVEEVAYVLRDHSGDEEADPALWLDDARAVIPVVTRAVAGRARREALEEAADLIDARPALRVGSLTGRYLRRLAAPATDDTEGEGRGR